MSRDIIIVQKRMISFIAACSALLFLIVFIAGYYVGRTQSAPAQISFSSFDQEIVPEQSIEENDPSGSEETTKSSPNKEPEQLTENPQPDTVDSDHDSSAEADDDNLEAIPNEPPATLAQPETTPELVATATASAEDETQPRKGFALQVAAFGKQLNAERFLEKLKDKGYQTAFLHEDDQEKNRLRFSVRIGFYVSYSEALKAANEFKLQEDRSAMIVNRVIEAPRNQPAL